MSNLILLQDEALNSILGGWGGDNNGDNGDGEGCDCGCHHHHHHHHHHCPPPVTTPAFGTGAFEIEEFAF